MNSNWIGWPVKNYPYAGDRALDEPETEDLETETDFDDVEINDYLED